MGNSSSSCFCLPATHETDIDVEKQQQQTDNEQEKQVQLQQLSDSEIVQRLNSDEYQDQWSMLAFRLAELTKEDVSKRIKLASLGIIPPLLKLLQSDATKTFMRAAAALCNTSLSQETHQQFYEAGAIQQMIKYVSQKEIIYSGGAVMLLANLAKSQSLSESMLSMNILLELSKALGRFKEPHMHSTLADCLGKLTTNRNIEGSVGAEEVVKESLNVMQRYVQHYQYIRNTVDSPKWNQVHTKVIERFLKALHNIVSASPKFAEVICSHPQGIDAIRFWLLRLNSNQIKLHNISILKWISKAGHIQNIAQQGQCVSSIVQVLQGLQNLNEDDQNQEAVTARDVQKAAIVTIGDFASYQNVQIREQLIEHDAIQLIVTFLDSKRSSIKQLATKAISNISKDQMLRAILLDLNVVPTLISILKNGLDATKKKNQGPPPKDTVDVKDQEQYNQRLVQHEEHAQMWASNALRNLVQENELSIRQLIKENGIPVVVQALVKGSEEYTRKQALGIVCMVCLMQNQIPQGAIAICNANGASALLGQMRQALIGQIHNKNQWVAWTAFALSSMLEIPQCMPSVVQAFRVDSGRELSDAGAVSDTQVADIVKRTMQSQLEHKDMYWI